MTKRKLSVAELNAHLDEQLGALQRSALLFDEGYFIEARRMAVTLRVLLHSAKYPSLLKQLGRDGTSFVDTAFPHNPENLMPSHGLVSLRFGVNEKSYVARLDSDHSFTQKPFQEWWNAIVFSDLAKRQLSRADVVRTAADQDGGAHVDSALRADYAALRHENSLGWTTEQGIPLSGDPVYAAVRQIAHEVLKTFITGYRRTSDDVAASRKKSEISGGKMRFFPHEKIFFINEVARPITPDAMHSAEIMVDSITTGSVRIVINTIASEAITSPGLHKIRLVAGDTPKTGVFGEYTDAVIDRISIKEAAD